MLLAYPLASCYDKRMRYRHLIKRSFFFLIFQRWFCLCCTGWICSALLSASIFSAHATPNPTPTAVPACKEAVTHQTDILQIGGPFPFETDDPLLEVFFIGLGRDDGFFLRCGGQTLLIDGGYAEQYPALQRFLLQEHGSLRLGSILNTHQHDDHIGAQLQLLSRGGSAASFLSPLPPDAKNEAYQRLFPLLEKLSISYHQLAHGDLLDLGDSADADDVGAVPLSQAFAVQRENSALISVYRYTGNDAIINDSSLVLHITYGKRTLLLMADAAGKPQHFLREKVGTDLQADVVKVAHHGITPMVSTFMDVVTPSLAIVTNERKATTQQNRQFRLRRIPALYTAEGTIYLATDGNLWYVLQK